MFSPAPPKVEVTTLNWKFLAILLLAMGVFGSGMHFLHAFQVKRNSASLLTQAEREKEEGDMDKSLTYLGRYLLHEPQDLAALEKYGILLDDRGREKKSGKMLQSAFFHLERCLLRDDGNEEIRKRVVELAFALSRFNDAGKHLHILLQANPDQAKLEDRLGRCEELEKRFPEAKKWYKKAIGHDPQQVESYVHLAGLLRNSLDSADEADRVMKSLTEHNPQSAAAHLASARYWLAYDARSKEGRKNASLSVQKARALDANNLETALVSADLARSENNPALARKILTDGISQHPKEYILYRSFANLEAREGNVPAAIDLLRRGLKQLPEHNDLRHLLADLLVQNGNVAEAEELIAALRKVPYAPAILDYLEARVHACRKEWHQARRLLESARPHFFTDPRLSGMLQQATLLLAACHENLGNPYLALLAFQEASRQDPFSVGARVGLGTNLMALGRLDEAIQEFRKVLQFEKSPAEMPVVLARALIARNLQSPQGNRNWGDVETLLSDKGLAQSADAAILRAELTLLQDPGHTKEARQILEKARETSPDQAGLWIALANLAARTSPDQGLAVLDEAEKQPNVAGGVGLTLTRMNLLSVLPDGKGKQRLAALESKINRAPEEDREQLLAGLAGCQRRLGNTAEARRLWTELVHRQPANIPARLILFDLALESDKEAELKQTLNEIKNIEGGGPYWKYGEAARLARHIVKARQAKDAAKNATGDAGAESLIRARTLLRQAAKELPSWNRILALQGQLDLLEGKQENAIDNFQRARHLGNKSPLVVRALVELLLERKRYSEVDQEVRSMVDQERTLLSAGLGKLAASTLMRGQEPNPARALEFALKSVNPGSKNARDHLWLAQVLMALGHNSEAHAKLVQARDVDPENPEPWIALVRFLSLTRKTKEAEAAIEEAKKRLPPAKAPLTLGFCYGVVGKDDLALKNFELALQDQPHDSALLHSLALFCWSHNLADRAEKHLREIIDLGNRQKASADQVHAARTFLAFVLINKNEYGQYREALDLIEKNFRTGQAVVDDQLVKARLLGMRAENRREAIGLFEEVARHKALSATDRFILARLYVADKKPAQANTVMLTLLGSPEGKTPAFYDFYARMLLEKSETQGALGWLEKLADLEPDSFRTLRLRAKVLQAQGEDQRAIDLLVQRAQVKGPDAGGRIVKINLSRVAKALFELGTAPGAPPDYHRRAEVLFRELATESSSQKTYLALAEFLGKTKRLSEALDIYEKAWRSGEPEYPIALAILMLRENKADARAIERVDRWVDECLAKKPDSIPLRVVVADLRDLQERYEEAIAENRRFLAAQPNNAVALNNLALLLTWVKRDAEQALKLINQALQANGPGAELLDTRASIYMALNRTKDAVADLETAVDAAGTPRQYFHLAVAQLQMGDTSAAQETLRKAMRGGFREDQLHPLERPDYQRIQRQLCPPLNRKSPS